MFNSIWITVPYTTNYEYWAFVPVTCKFKILLLFREDWSYMKRKTVYLQTFPKMDDGFHHVSFSLSLQNLGSVDVSYVLMCLFSAYIPKTYNFPCKGWNTSGNPPHCFSRLFYCLDPVTKSRLNTLPFSSFLEDNAWQNPFNKSSIISFPYKLHVSYKFNEMIWNFQQSAGVSLTKPIVKLAKGYDNILTAEQTNKHTANFIADKRVCWMGIHKTKNWKRDRHVSNLQRSDWTAFNHR